MTTKKTTWKGVLGVRELKSYVDPYPDKVGTDRVPEECGRCGGTGYTSFVWVQNGICFHCGGSGKHYAAVSTVRKHAKEEAYYRDYADEIKAHSQAQWAEAERQRREEEFNAAWEEAHAEQARRNAMVQGYLAEVDEKIHDIEAEVVFEKYFEGSWNRSSSNLIIAKTDDGRILKTFTSSRGAWGLKRGDRFHITTATVKAHEQYRGQDQTVLTRVSIDDFEDRAQQYLVNRNTFGEDDIGTKAARSRIKKAEAERLQRWLAENDREDEEATT